MSPTVDNLSSLSWHSDVVCWSVEPEGYILFVIRPGSKSKGASLSIIGKVRHVEHAARFKTGNWHPDTAPVVMDLNCGLVFIVKVRRKALHQNNVWLPDSIGWDNDFCDVVIQTRPPVQKIVPPVEIISFRTNERVIFIALKLTLL